MHLTASLQGTGIHSDNETQKAACRCWNEMLTLAVWVHVHLYRRTVKSVSPAHPNLLQSQNCSVQIL